MRPTDHSVPDAPGVTTFRSNRHPGSASRGMTFALRLITPLASCLLPVMIAILVGVLEGRSVLPYLVYAAPAAIGLAAVWTLFQMFRLPAEILLRPDAAAVRTIWERASPEAPARWFHVLDARDYGTWILVTVGRTSYQLYAADWPEYAALAAALRQAYRFQRQAPSPADPSAP